MNVEELADEHDVPPPKSAKVKQIADARKLARGDHAEIAELLCFDIGPNVVHTEGRFWRYEAPVYQPIAESELSTLVQGYAGRSVKAKRDPLRLKASDVAGSIKLASHRLDRPGHFDGAPAGIAFADRFVAVLPDGLVTRSHSADHRARVAYPFPYASAEPQMFLRFLCDVWRDDADGLEKVRFLQEYGGACLTGVASRFALAVVLFGESAANGKSTLIRIMLDAMPARSTSAIPPQLWASEYRRAQLAGVRLNAVSELPDADISDSEIFKSVVAGDPIDARTIRESPFTFSPTAGHVFATNRLPSVGDLTWGFFRRLAFLTFNRRFEAHEQNASLADEIVKAERPAIVAWFLEGAARLLARGRYLVPSSSTGQVDEWRRTADSVSCFVTERCDEHATGPTQAALLFDSYREWAISSGYRPVNTKNFAQRLSALGHPRSKQSAGHFYPLEIRRVP